MFKIQHESGAFYTFTGKTPHVAADKATTFPSLERAQKVVNIINTAGRGTYTAVPATLRVAA